SPEVPHSTFPLPVPARAGAGPRYVLSSPGADGVFLHWLSQASGVPVPGFHFTPESGRFHTRSPWQPGDAFGFSADAARHAMTTSHLPVYRVRADLLRLPDSPEDPMALVWPAEPNARLAFLKYTPPGSFFVS